MLSSWVAWPERRKINKKSAAARAASGWVPGGIGLEIISVSIDKETLGELDRMQESMGFKSRSKLLRATINSMLNEYQALDALRGHSDSVMVLTYKAAAKDRISSIVHGFGDQVKTTVHQHHAGVCIDILVVCCDAADVRRLFSALKRENGVRSLSCSVL